MPRSLFGTCSHLLLVLVLAAGAPARAFGETITYSFTGVVDELVDAPATGVPSWAVVGAPVRGILRWETGLEDSDPDPNVGSFFSPEGAVVIDFSGDRTFHTFNRTQAVPDAPQGIYVGVNKQVIPSAPSDVFSLNRSWTMMFLDVPGLTEEIPDSLPVDGNHRFLVQDYYLTPYNNVLTSYFIGGSLTSLKRIEETPTWTGSAGSWQDPTNWSSGLVPNEIGISATFGPHITGPTTVTVDSAVELTDLVFDSPEHSYTIAGPGPLRFFAPASIDVISGSHAIAAPIAGNLEFSKWGAGTLRLEGEHEIKGLLRLEEGAIELLEGNLRVSQFFSLNGDMLIGPEGRLTGGSSNFIALEEGTASTVVVDGGQWDTPTSSLQFHVGYRGDGRLTIKNGGLVKSGLSRVGGIPGSRGEVVVTGEGSTWESGERLEVGGLADGQIYDRDGNPVGDPKTPTLGILTIEQGGKVVSAQGWVDPTGTVLVRGAESSWTIKQQLHIHGTVTIESATLSTGNTSWNYSSMSRGGTLLLTEGARWENFDGVIVGYEGLGNLTIASGSRVEQTAWFGESTIGERPGSQGEVLITGEDSSLQISGRLTVGRFGTGRIRIEDGGTLSMGDRSLITIADYSGTHAEIVVSGVDSLFSTWGEVRFGREGTSRLLIEKGAHVLHQSRFVYPPVRQGGDTVLIGGRSSEVTVTGEGSRWEIQGALELQSPVVEASVTVVDGGAVASWYGTVEKRGSFTLTDPGSRWDVLDWVQVSGGELTVKDGAALHSTRAAFGTSAEVPTAVRNAAEVLVSGAGTTWTSTERIYLGSKPAVLPKVDRLTVSDQAVLTTPLLEIRPTGLLTGDGGTVIGDIVNSGTIAPGNSPGRLTIDGNFTQSAGGHLAFEIGGPEAFDQLIVTGHASLAGTLSVELLDGYVPAPGTTFQLFEFGSLEGELTLEFPGLGGGLGWDTRQLLSTGAISVAPMSAIPEPRSLGVILLFAMVAVSLHRQFAICTLQLPRVVDPSHEQYVPARPVADEHQERPVGVKLGVERLLHDSRAR